MHEETQNAESVAAEEQALKDAFLAASEVRREAEAKFDLANHDYVAAKHALYNFQARQRILQRIDGSGAHDAATQ